MSAATYTDILKPSFVMGKHEKAKRSFRHRQHCHRSSCLLNRPCGYSNVSSSIEIGVTYVVPPPTATPLPTATFFPTFTPLPTPTRLPTVTPEPTAADAGERAYLTTTATYISGIRSTLLELQRLQNLAWNTPAYLSSRTWKAQYLTQIALLFGYTDNLQNLAAPSERFAVLHLHLTDAAGYYKAGALLCAQAMDVVEAVDEVDAVARIDACTDQIRLATQAVQDATAEKNRLISE